VPTRRDAIQLSAVGDSIENRVNLDELLDRCLEKDERAWQTFVDLFNRTIVAASYRACMAIRNLGVSSGECVAELVQDVYIRLLDHNARALRAWRGADIASMKKYLAVITRTVASDKLRRQQSHKRFVVLVPLDAPTREDDGPALSEALSAPAYARPDKMVDGRLEEERLLRALSEACTGPNGSRNSLMFQLHVLDGFSAREIAQMPVFGLSSSNVETILRRTRERVRNLLQSGAD
jgi:RNA polymerase sigma-70 factor (ECF subfamily)